MKLKLKQVLILNPAGQPLLLMALQTVRRMPLPVFRSYDVIKLCRELEVHAKDALEARNAAIKKHGHESETGFVIDPGTAGFNAYLAEIETLAAQEISVSLAEKIPLPRLAAITADELEILEPLCELEAG